jgi:hypothetical protein
MMIYNNPRLEEYLNLNLTLEKLRHNRVPSVSRRI